MAYFCESVGVFALGLVGAPFLSYLCGSCWLFIFIADDIRASLVTFGTDVILDENATNTKRRSDALMNKFCAAVQTYTDAKECEMLEIQ